MALETGRPTDVDPEFVLTRDDLSAFLYAVLNDFERGGGREEWENATLDRFLDGLAAFALARVHGAGEQEDASWRLFAQMIVAATGYE